MPDLGAEDMVKKMAPFLKLFICKLTLSPVFQGYFVFTAVLKSGLFRKPFHSQMYYNIYD